MVKTRFKGHETFFFREGWLQKALFEINANRNLELFSGNNGIVKLGVGANMVKSIKYWMLTSGILQYKNREYELTKLGETIAINDVYLENIFSLSIIHINLVRNYENATTWNLFFNVFKGEIFESADIKDVLSDYLKSHDIKFSEKSLDTDINVLLNMYSKKNENDDPEENYICPLSNLGLIKYSRKKYQRSLPELNTVSEYLVLYVILLLIEDKGESSNRSISISDLEKTNNSLVSIFNFNRIIINEYLEQLASMGYLRIEKTAGLDMIYVTCDYSPDQIIELYYEGEK